MTEPGNKLKSEDLGSPENKVIPAIYTVIILNAEGKLLLSHKIDPKGIDPPRNALISGIGSSTKFNLMGIEAACGEVKADLGTESFEGEEIFTKPLHDGGRAKELHLYKGHVNESEIQTTKFSDGHIWVTLEEAMNMELPFDQNEMLEHYRDWRDRM